MTTPYSKGKFNPSLPEGHLELNNKGKQVPIMWIYCDDFLVHAATHKDCCQAVAVVIETLLHLGLLAHPSKIKWPAPSKHFCGIIYNSADTPCVKVPEDK
eukprot:10680957-Ditylum_brightwellii.AAC.2